MRESETPHAQEIQRQKGDVWYVWHSELRVRLGALEAAKGHCRMRNTDT